jgi:hypothetical protein
MPNSVTRVLASQNVCSYRSTVRDNGAVTVYATMARHAIVALEIVGNAGVPPFRPQVHRAPTMDIRHPVNAAMVSIIPYKLPPSLPRAIPRLVPGLIRGFVRFVLRVPPVCPRVPALSPR